MEKTTEFKTAFSDVTCAQPKFENGEQSERGEIVCDKVTTYRVENQAPDRNGE